MIAWQFADAGMEHKKPQNKNSIDDKINDDVTNHFNTSIFLRKLYLVNFNEDIFFYLKLYFTTVFRNSPIDDNISIHPISFS